MNVSVAILTCYIRKQMGSKNILGESLIRILPHSEIIKEFVKANVSNRTKKINIK